MSNILIYLSLALVVLWTVRLARSKGRNPFIWGGLALGLMLIPSWPALLGMAPMIVLLFLKTPQAAHQEIAQEPVTCPKCRAFHAPGHTYCVNCGWELAKPYLEDTPLRYEDPPLPRIRVEEAEPALRPTESASPDAEAATVAAEDPPTEVVSAEEDQTDESRSSEPAEVREPSFRRPLTPASFTEHGLALFNQGKFQEAVDQFTKAIALDPRYVPAWAKRAEAYLRLGRKNKAEEDRHHLDGLQGQVQG